MSRYIYIYYDQLIACQDVKDYLFHSEEPQLMSTMICALNADLAVFLEGISNLSYQEYAHLTLTHWLELKPWMSGTTTEGCPSIKLSKICCICSKCLRSGQGLHCKLICSARNEEYDSQKSSQSKPGPFQGTIHCNEWAKRHNLVCLLVELQKVRTNWRSPSRRGYVRLSFRHLRFGTIS